MNTPEAKLIKLPEVKRLVGLGKTSIYSLMKIEKFPQQVPMGIARCVFWSNLEIHKWIESPDDYVPKVRRSK